MSENPVENNPADVQARTSKKTSRRRTRLRRFYYWLGLALLKMVIRSLWASYRMEKIIGEDIAKEMRDSGKTYAPCLWHQQLVLAAMLAYRWVNKNGYKACFVISASVDGDVPSQLTLDGTSSRFRLLALRGPGRRSRSGSVAPG